MNAIAAYESEKYHLKQHGCLLVSCHVNVIIACERGTYSSGQEPTDATSFDVL